MGAHDLTKVSPQKGELLYVDTSALWAICISVRAGKMPKENWQQSDVNRGKTASAFLRKVVKDGVHVLVTPLQYEEVAFAMRSKLTKPILKNAGYSKWHEFVLYNPTAAKAEGEKVALQTLGMINEATNFLATLPVQPCWFACQPGDVLVVGRKLRDALRALVKSHSEIDPMDALHIVVGAELGAKSFVSLDTAWRSIPTIDVYYCP